MYYKLLVTSSPDAEVVGVRDTEGLSGFRSRMQSSSCNHLLIPLPSRSGLWGSLC